MGNLYLNYNRHCLPPVTGCQPQHYQSGLVTLFIDRGRCNKLILTWKCILANSYECIFLLLRSLIMGKNKKHHNGKNSH